jgi:hypothetical protein
MYLARRSRSAGHSFGSGWLLAAAAIYARRLVSL